MRIALVILGALVVIPRTSLAQNRPLTDGRILVDVNIGTATSLAKDREFQSRFLTFSEIGSEFASYPKPSGAMEFDVGGSYMLTRWLGVGVSYTHTAYEDGADLKATIPHPTFYSSPATNTGVTGESLKRREGMTNFSAVVVPLRTGRLEWRWAGGLTIFSLKADMVNDVLYTQTFTPSSPQQTIAVTGYTTSQVTASDYGGHVGTDATFFLTDLVGIGVGARYSYGTVTLDEEPLSKLSQEIRVGGTQVFAGLRLRFDR
jgi:hypothetical protein